MICQLKPMYVCGWLQQVCGDTYLWLAIGHCHKGVVSKALGKSNSLLTQMPKICPWILIESSYNLFAHTHFFALLENWVNCASFGATVTHMSGLSLLWRVSKLWMPRSQDSIVQHPFDPEGGPERDFIKPWTQDAIFQHLLEP